MTTVKQLSISDIFGPVEGGAKSYALSMVAVARTSQPVAYAFDDEEIAAIRGGDAINTDSESSQDSICFIPSMQY